jgi:ribosome biogenesis GTPase / thiamine phosphate phosphatase
VSSTSPSHEPLRALGWDATFHTAFDALGDARLIPARVTAQHRGRWVVAHAATDSDGDALAESSAVLAGRLRHAVADAEGLPAVGDWVTVVPAAPGGEAVIAHVLPRRTAFVRRAAGEPVAAQVVAANVDVALVVDPLAPGASRPNARRLERYVALAWESGALPAVVLTKADLCADLDAAVAAARAAAPGAEVLALSSVTGANVAALDALLAPGRTAVLLGPSGAGKSTLANRLLGHDRLATREVRPDGKGRHTTTHRELLRLAGGALLVDTPGMRELALWDADAGLDGAFAEVVALAGGCRFRDCAHEGEPGCAVRAAVADGRLDAARLAHWHALRRELAYLERQQDDHARRAHEARVRALDRAGWEHIREKRGRG